MNQVQANVRTFPLALSDSDGQCDFAFADPDKENQGMGSLVNFKNEVVSRFEQIPTQTLDHFIRDHQISHVDLIKVDIQGAEIAFLEGGASFLKKFGPDLVVEVSASDLACVQKTPKDLFEALERLGYTIYLFNNKGASSHRVTSTTVNNVRLSLNIFCTKRNHLPA